MNRVYLLLLLSLALSACSKQYANQNVLGKSFPSVVGESLQGEVKQLPADVQSNATILLIGYVQNSQFDIDRWLIGMDMVGVKAPAYEIPTIAGLFPQFFETQINDGMRKGIPKELWKGVITIYDDGETVQQFTGNTNPNNARVMVLNSVGEVIYFYDRGFSVDALKNLVQVIEQQYANKF